MLLDGRFFIPESEFEWRFVTASGPGGQHVNKSSTAVQLRFDVAHSLYLPEEIRERLLRRLASQLTSSGELLISAQDSRSQLLNRREALSKLENLLAAALIEPKKRRRTRPTQASVRKRLVTKKIRGSVKKLRSGGINTEDE